jgi:hypothetical protein
MLGLGRKLETVFNMGTAPGGHTTYVDRGELDRRVRSALDSGIHVAIHGESKHGKSWLRAHTLPEKTIARVQCLPGMSTAEVLEQALGRLGIFEQLTISVEASSTSRASAGAKVTVKAAEVGAHAEEETGQRTTVHQRPVGQNRRDIGWVAEQFRANSRTPVFEDFHHLDTDTQFAMSYIIKALGEWDVSCVIVGIWTDTHRLKLYNAELDGRIEDLKLAWTVDELQLVVQRGCSALNVEISEQLRRQLVRDAYTSVGLLQELTKATLEAAGIRRRALRRKTVDDPAALASGRARVVQGIGARFDPFIQQFPTATVQDIRPGLYRLITQTVTRVSEQKLLDGLTAEDLHREITIDDAGADLEHVSRALESIEDAQRAVGIKHPVLAWDPARSRVILADRRLLLYLRERASQ